MSKKLIGLLGPAGVGKDTAADHLVKSYGFIKMSLADEMKRICMRVYGFTLEQLWGPSQNRNAPDPRYRREDGSYLSPRVALQILGTEFGRACYVNTWVDKVVRDSQAVLQGNGSYTQQGGWVQYGALDPAPNGVVVPDCRFQNEIDAIRKAGGVTIRLKRATKADALTVGVKNHASETEQLSIPDSAFDHVVEVPDGIDNYHKVLDSLVEKIG